MPAPIKAVAYFRMSSSPQEKSIPQQRTEMLPRCKLEGVEIVQEFKDEGISGRSMKRRDAFQEMLAYCQEQHDKGQPVAAVVCFDTSRFSRADSNETASYIWAFRKAGVNRLLTFEKWYDFRKEEDRALFNIQQDFTNNRYLRDHSLRVLRGKKDTAQAGYFTGGTVPYAFCRVLLDEKGNEVRRLHRGEKIGVKMKGWHEVLAPVGTDDPSPDRQLERQTVVWLFTTLLNNNVSLRWLAEQLNEKGVPGPGSFYQRRGSTGATSWNPKTIKAILANPVYRGTSRLGAHGTGAFHRLVNGSIEAAPDGAKRIRHAEGHVLTRLEHGGLVTPEIWEAVQEKLDERTRKKMLARKGGYTLPSGILHCGHCGGRMYGTTTIHRPNGKEYVYRRYACGTPNAQPGKCQHYAIKEEVIVKLLVRKLQEVYLAPERLEKLRAELRRQVEERQHGDPERKARLQARISGLDSDIQQGRRNLLRAKDDETFGELNTALQELLGQRRKLQQELDEVKRQQGIPQDEAERQVEAAVAVLYGLKDKLQKAKREQLGEVIRRLVNRVDLHFERQDGTKRPKWFRFVKGVIQFQPLLHVKGSGKSLR